MNRNLLSYQSTFLQKLFETSEGWLQKVSTKKVWFLLIVFLLASFVTVFRRVEVITDPQFYAEDGVFWYTEAYHSDNWFLPFLTPKQAYFQTISRIGALVALPFDIQYAPLIFNSIAIFITVLPVVFFLSSRFQALIPKISYRVFLSLMYLCLPGASEVHANLTNAHWHLALLMILVILAPVGKTLFWKIFDGMSLFIAGLSGPFVFFALPIFVISLYCTYVKEKKFPVAVLALTFLIQMYSFFFMLDTGAPRSNAPLGVSIVNFSTILGGNVFLKGMLGPQLTNEIRDWRLWENGIFPVITSLLGLLVLGYFFRTARLEARLFVGFLFLVFIGSLISPQAHVTEPQWEVMSGGSAGRYYYLPIIGWITALASLAILEKKTVLKIVFSLSILCFSFVAVPKDYEVKKLRNYHFREQVAEFHALPKGESFSFKIPPGWHMTLEKK